MIITCPSCEKKFEIDAALIPDKGRTLKCGSCDNVWFFKKGPNLSIEKEIPKSAESKLEIFSPKLKKKEFKKNVEKNINYSTKDSSALIKYDGKQNFTIGKFLSYLIVLIISFVAVLILVDTFKKPIYKIFPNIEFILFSLFETIKDIILFFKNLIH